MFTPPFQFLLASIDTWIQWYFDFPPTRSGEKIFWVLVRRDYFPAWLLLGVIILGLGISHWFIRRESLGRTVWIRTGLRAVILGLIVVMLWQVTLRGTHRGQPLLTIVIDDSASMQSTDTYSVAEQRELKAFSSNPNATSRQEFIERLFAAPSDQWFKELQSTRRLDIRNLTGDRTFSERNTDVSAAIRGMSFAAPTTDLQMAVEAVFADYRGALPDSLIVLTDGNSSVGEAGALSQCAARCAKAQLPLSVIGIGSTQTPVDVTIEARPHSTFGFAGTPVDIEFDIGIQGSVAGTVEVELQDQQNEMIDSGTFAIPATGPMQLRVPELKPGRNEFRIAVNPWPGEANLFNNEQRLRIWARESRLKVLYVERRPRWEFHHLKKTLERDANVDLDVMLLDADRDYILEDQSAIPQLPTAASQLAEYDLFILGDVDLSQLPSRFVPQLTTAIKEDSSGLLLISGTQFNPGAYQDSPLSPMLPVSAQVTGKRSPMPVTLQLTLEGRESGLFTTSEKRKTFQEPDSYPLDISTFTMRPGAFSLVEARLADNSKMPQIVSMRFGTGHVMQHLLDDTWRWRSSPGLYEQYWSQVVRYLSKQRLQRDRNYLELIVARDQFQQHAPVELILHDQLAQPPTSNVVEVSLQHDQNSRTKITLSALETDPRVFRTVLENLPPGTYVASLQLGSSTSIGTTTTWRVHEVDQERSYAPLNRDDLEKAARISRGGFYNLWEVEELLKELPKTSRGQQLHSEEVAIWNRWEVLVLLVLCLGLDWVCQQRSRR